MEEQFSVVPGSKIHTLTGLGNGRVGAIVVNQEGQRFALSARHVLDCEGGGEIYNNRNLTPVGVVSNLTVDGNSLVEPLPFFEAVGAISLASPQIVAEMNTSFGPVSQAVDPLNLIGEFVSIIGLKLPPRSVEVISAGGHIYFESPFEVDKRHLFDGVIELELPEEFEDFSLAGEGGSLIVSESCQAVGILIARTGSRLFAAPLLPLMRKYGLKFVSNAAKPTTEQIQNPGVLIQIMNSGFRQASLGLIQLKNEMALGEGAAVEDEVSFSLPPNLIEAAEFSEDADVFEDMAGI